MRVKKILAITAVCFMLCGGYGQIFSGITSAHDDGNDMPNYIQPNDRLVKEIVQEKTTNSMSLIEKAKALYDYVAKSIEYESDKDVWGKRDYWQFPSTTIQKGTGDCEDQAILLTSLLRSAGFSRDNVRLVYGKVVNLFSGKLVGYHCWVEIKPNTEQITEISQHYTPNLEELAGKNVTIHTNDGDLTSVINGNKLAQFSALGLGTKDGWIPLDATANIDFILFRKPISFESWLCFGYYIYTVMGYQVKPLEYYIDPLPPTEVTLNIEKEDYGMGELINFTVTNHGDNAIYFSSTASPYKIYRSVPTGTSGGVIHEVYSPKGISLPALTPLKDGESRTWSWDQKNNDGLQVSEGQYIVIVYYYEQDEAMSLSKSFTISSGYKWVYSGKDLHDINFLYVTYDVGIEAKIFAPTEVELGKEYSIDAYFKRKSISPFTPNGKQMLDIPIEVKISAGMGMSGSNEHVFQVGIGINKWDEWVYCAPITTKGTQITYGNFHPIILTGNITWNSGFSTVAGITSSNSYRQDIHIQIPQYSNVADIPAEWDGPYKINLKVDVSSASSNNAFTITTPSFDENTILVKNIELNNVKIIDTPYKVNYPSPGISSLNVSIMQGSVNYVPARVIAENGSTYLAKGATKAKLEVPITVNNSQIFVQTGGRQVRVTVMPDDIITSQKLSSVKEITLKMEKNYQPVYEVKGKIKTKLFRLFSTTEKVTIKVDAITGERISLKEPWWGFLT